MSMTHDEMIAVIQAHKDGKKIEFSHKGSDWISIENPRWTFEGNVYRISQNQKKQVKLLAWFDGEGLFWFAEYTPAIESNWKRVPSEDKVIEIED